jgi:hypothetical protein|tara:strand:+ start:132 stop:326 length:195 start_codon:yes stop_codon:yes gene_type:complete
MDTQKPGYKTTEFWLALSAVLLGAVLGSGAVPSEGPWVQVVALMETALVAMGYTGARLTLKRGG